MADEQRWSARWSCGNCGYDNVLAAIRCDRCGDARCPDCRTTGERQD